MIRYFLPLILLLNQFLPAQTCLTFDSLPPGTTFGSEAGHRPGDLVYTAHEIPVAVDSFYFSGRTGAFQSCRLLPADPGFSDSPHLELNNISLVFGFPGNTAYELKLAYHSRGGLDNLQVNDGPLHMLPLGEVPFHPAPGIMAFPTTGTDTELLTLVGPVSSLRIGGQELLLDDVCIRKNDFGNPSACNGFDELDTGQTFGLGPWVKVVEESEDFQAYILTDSFPGAATGTTPLITVVDDHPGFSSSPHLQLDDIGIYIQPLLPLWPGYHLPRLTFKYRSLVELEHFSVNEWPPYEGPLADIPWDYFPDCIISQYFESGANYLSIEGELREIHIAGQQLLVDDICMSPITDVEEALLPERLPVNVFPNPASSGSTLYIRLEDPSLWNTVFELYDSNGRRVEAAQELQAELTEISLRGLTPGLYFFRLLKEGVLQRTGKVVIQ